MGHRDRQGVMCQHTWRTVADGEEEVGGTHQQALQGLLRPARGKDFPQNHPLTPSGCLLPRMMRWQICFKSSCGAL